MFALFALFLPALPAVDAEKIDNRDFAIDTCFPTPNEIQLAEGRTRVFFTGIIAGMILFSIIRALRGRYAYSLGLALGIAMGVPAALISHRVGQTAGMGPWLSEVWVLGLVLLWGATLGWADRWPSPVGLQGRSVNLMEARPSNATCQTFAYKPLEQTSLFTRPVTY